MTPILSGTAFVVIVGCMFLTLTGFSALARQNRKRRLRQIPAQGTTPRVGTAKVIVLPQNTLKSANEQLFVQEPISKEEAN